MTLLPVALSLLILLPEAQWASPMWREPIGPKRAESAAAWQGPVAGRISSRFGVRRHPLRGTRQQHAGMDIAAKQGSRVRAMQAGRVIAAGWSGAYGQRIDIDHGDGWHSRYAHLHQILVEPGKTVQAGDILGTVGATGAVTGPHLHVEIVYEGTAINPLVVLKSLAQHRR